MGITIGKKKLNSGRVSLFLDYSFNGERKKEYLGLILESPSSTSVRKMNKEKIELALHIRAKRELETIEACYEIKRVSTPQKKVDFFQIFEEYIQTYARKDAKVVFASRGQLLAFTKGKALFVSQIDERFCQNFYDFLKNRLRGATPTGYFKKFRMCLEQCVDQKIITENPSRKVKMVHSEELIKNILNTDEIQELALTPCKNEEIKRAFLFACNSGLRWCDIYALQYKSIDFSNKLLRIIQQKVQGHSSKATLHLNLNATAILLLKPEENASPEEKVFRLPSYSYSLRVLRNWVKEAGVRKHITFHCGRHSFITNIIVNGANIRTAAALAGHSSIHHTEKYLHVIDELKQKAVDSLPELQMDL